ELGEIADFDPDQVRLEALQLCQADGLVFARARDVPGFRPEITRVMSEVASQVGEQALQCRYHSSASYEIGCNWKVYVDNYLEGYHIPQVHPALAQMLDYREYETRLYDGFSLQHSDIRDGSGAYQQGEAFYYYLFPNMMLNILPGRLQTNVVVPLAADRCRVDFHYYYDNIDDADFIAADQALGDDVQKEDVAICEHVQRGLQSGVYDAGRLSEAREAGVHHWQELYRRVCRETLAGV
ncbi:MAG: aromatic ring-hydroxylating dioxygenase subunit alpha, partial [Gammaproteobacteria bacterium]|nr:aromatic ring-hydroxylating dioxygenase subunit alpha [Gammaproteobacteria bacterium]